MSMLLRRQTIYDWLCLGWLIGPIFGKELRVSSRRRRNYVIRAIYIAVLAVLLFFVWMTMPVREQSMAFQSRQLADFGRVLTMMVTWSQFFLCQIVAVVMLSTAISDEIYHKTLGVLMTTPISGFQIVAGKLLSKLLQLLLLLGISLPVLAMVRVFGGIPWTYVLCSVCVTLSVSLLAGSLSLYYSISQRRAYIVIVQTIVTFIVVFALIPLFTIWFADDVIDISVSKLVPYFMMTNPYAVKALATDWLMSPRGMSARMMGYWPLHCAGMLGVAAVLLLLATIRVRKVALRQIAGSSAVAGPKRKKKKAKAQALRRSWLNLNMGNWPVLWKDLRTPVFGRSRVRKVIAALLVLGVLGFIYIGLGLDSALDDSEVHAVFCCLLTILATIFTAIIPATCVTSEKEARSWPLLLGTTHSDWRILFSKWLAMLRWCLPSWMLLFGHVLFFTLIGIIHPVALIHQGIVMAGIVNLLIGTGLYWSTCLRRTTTAVVCNFIVPLIIWLVIPVLCIVVIEINNMSGRSIERYMRWHPFFQAGVIGEACTSNQGHLRMYDWVSTRLNVWESTLLLLGTACVYSMIGLGFGWFAKCLFRRKIF
jgi:ABC-2 type transport system permease protein